MADDTFNEHVSRARLALAKVGWRVWNRPSFSGGEVIVRPVDDDSIPVYLSEGKAITDPDEAEALGLTADFDGLNPVVRAAVLEDRRRLWREQNADKVRANEGLDPWTVEMLSAIADANEAYKEGDCE